MAATNNWMGKLSSATTVGGGSLEGAISQTVNQLNSATLNKIHPALIKIASKSWYVNKHGYYGSYLKNRIIYKDAPGTLSDSYNYCPAASPQKIVIKKYGTNIDQLLIDIGTYGSHRQICSPFLMGASNSDNGDEYMMMFEVENDINSFKTPSKKAVKWEVKSTKFLTDADMTETYTFPGDGVSPFCIKACVNTVGDSESHLYVFYTEATPKTVKEGSMGASNKVMLPHYDFNGTWYWQSKVCSSAEEVLTFLNTEIEPKFSFLCKISSYGQSSEEIVVFYPSTTPFAPFKNGYKIHIGEDYLMSKKLGRGAHVTFDKKGTEGYEDWVIHGWNYNGTNLYMFENQHSGLYLNTNQGSFVLGDVKQNFLLIPCGNDKPEYYLQVRTGDFLRVKNSEISIVHSSEEASVFQIDPA